mmetsp:Transcript_9879/g.26837  ORF Transcript_9879/g.26837 Transcript_9879/m.26837 type:complete len:214 (-) Transcript_9879:817-1458(-)
MFCSAWRMPMFIKSRAPSGVLMPPMRSEMPRACARASPAPAKSRLFLRRMPTCRRRFAASAESTLATLRAARSSSAEALSYSPLQRSILLTLRHTPRRALSSTVATPSRPIRRYPSLESTIQLFSLMTTAELNSLKPGLFSTSARMFLRSASTDAWALSASTLPRSLQTSSRPVCSRKALRKASSSLGGMIMEVFTLELMAVYISYTHHTRVR